MAMKNHARLYQACLLLLALATISAGALADELCGRVVAVADGDTITVLDEAKQQHKIRLNGIDAPEKNQDFGQASKQHLSDLVFGKDVVVSWSKIDKYGRIVGTVLIGSTNANLEQLKAGFAWYYCQYESDVPVNNRSAYAAAEADARQAARHTRPL